MGQRNIFGISTELAAQEGELVPIKEIKTGGEKLASTSIKDSKVGELSAVTLSSNAPLAMQLATIAKIEALRARGTIQPIGSTQQIQQQLAGPERKEKIEVKNITQSSPPSPVEIVGGELTLATIAFSSIQIVTTGEKTTAEVDRTIKTPQPVLFHREKKKELNKKYYLKEEAIIEAIIVKQSEQDKLRRGEKIMIVAPKEQAKKWPDGRYTEANSKTEFIKVPGSYGPARLLSIKEYLLIKEQITKETITSDIRPGKR